LKSGKVDRVLLRKENLLTQVRAEKLLFFIIMLMHKHERIDTSGSFSCIEGAVNVRFDGMIFRVFFCQ